MSSSPATTATSTNVRLSDCLDDDVLIATQFDGKPVTREHGGPARVIIPKLYAWKGAKFVRQIEFCGRGQARLLGSARLQQHRRSLDGRSLLVSDSAAPRARSQSSRPSPRSISSGVPPISGFASRSIHPAVAHGGHALFLRRVDHATGSPAGRAHRKSTFAEWRSALHRRRLSPLLRQRRRDHRRTMGPDRPRFAPGRDGADLYRAARLAYRLRAATAAAGLARPRGRICRSRNSGRSGASPPPAPAHRAPGLGHVVLLFGSLRLVDRLALFAPRAQLRFSAFFPPRRPCSAAAR